MNLPIAPNRKRGAQRRNQPALVRQPTDLQEFEPKGIEMSQEFSESLDPESSSHNPQKRRKLEEDLHNDKKCNICNEPLKKRKYWYCMNKCKILN